MIEFKPPQQIKTNKNITSIFIGGTIDMGDSVEWQNEVIKQLEDKNCYVYNPRRESWDQSWVQNIENPQFYQQVNWELNALDKADYVIINLLPNSKSPISLLELGLYANSGKLLVCCPKEFYRSGNIQIVCDKFNIPIFETLNELLLELKPFLK